MKKESSRKSNSGAIEKAGGGLCGVGGESQHYSIVKVPQFLFQAAE